MASTDTTGVRPVQAEFLRVKEAAVALRMSEGSVRAMIADGRLGAVRLTPRGTRIPRVIIDRMIEKAMQRAD